MPVRLRPTFAASALGLTVVALWLVGPAILAPGALIGNVSWLPAAWSVCLLLVAGAIPRVYAQAGFLEQKSVAGVEDWVALVGMGFIAWLAGWLDLFELYDGLQPSGIGQHSASRAMARVDAWWVPAPAYPGDAIGSLVIGVVAATAVGAWAWRRQWPDLAFVACVSLVSLSAAASVRDNITGSSWIITSTPPDAAGFFWTHFAATTTSGAVLARIFRAGDGVA